MTQASPHPSDTRIPSNAATGLAAGLLAGALAVAVNPVQAAATPGAGGASTMDNAAAAAPATARPQAAAAAQPASAGSGQPARATPAVPYRPLRAPVWVALDVGHRPGEGSPSASGLPEFNFNLAFAAALEQQLRARGIAVRRLPVGQSLAYRAQRAQGASLVLSVHHDAAQAVKGTAPASVGGAQPVSLKPGSVPSGKPSQGSGYVLTIAQRSSLACAQSLGLQLQTAGRHFAVTPGVNWADKHVGVRAHGRGALLQQDVVPVVQLSLANIGNPAEEKLALQPSWVGRQAQAVATGIQQCLTRPAVAQGVARG